MKNFAKIGLILLGSLCFFTTDANAAGGGNPFPAVCRIEKNTSGRTLTGKSVSCTMWGKDRAVVMYLGHDQRYLYSDAEKGQSCATESKAQEFLALAKSEGLCK